MKRLMAVLMCLVLFAGAAMPAFACRNHRHYTAYGRSYNHRYARTSYTRGYAPRSAYYSYRPYHRTFWQKHRDKLTLAMGTAGGAALGGLIGGKRGAGIGALSGAAGSALYTYKLRKRHHRY